MCTFTDIRQHWGWYEIEIPIKLCFVFNKGPSQYFEGKRIDLATYVTCQQ